MRAVSLLVPVCLAVTLPARAEMTDDEARAQFVASNMIATFYHEFGHALVDLLDIPVLGREEDAVDALSTLLVDLLWEPGDAEILIAEVAYGYALRIAHEDALDDSVWWAEHALDEQRLAAMVCQFFGADPEARLELAVDLGMPGDMTESCIHVSGQLADSWAVFLDDLIDTRQAHGLDLLEPAADAALADLLREEIALINALFGLPVPVDVSVESCGEANAFYDPALTLIIMCTELAQWYGDAWDADDP